MDYSEVGRLPFDEDGFLVGIKRIDQKFSDIEQDIAEILSILRNTKSFKYTDKQDNNVPYRRSIEQNNQKVIDTLELINETQEETNKIIGDNVNDTRTSNSERVTNTNVDSTAQENENVNSFERKRDSNGRFVGANTDGSQDTDTDKSSEEKGYIKSILGKVSNGVSFVTGKMPDSRGIDPTVDAVHELNESLSPVKKMAGAVFRPLSGLMKSKKRNEPIPREQARHNSRVLSILNQISRQSGNTLSLFGLVRTVPMIAVALGTAVTLGLVSWWKGGGFSGIRSGSVNGSTASAGLARINPTQDQKGTIKDSYESAINAGFSHDQAIALVGENGRENDFNQNLMYGSHNDPARGKNLGIFSWQGKRREGLVKYLSSKGLMNADGTISRSKEGLQAQYEYARMEMEKNPKWKKTFLDKKNISNDEARQALGGVGSYVGWARGQDQIRKADGTLVPFDWKKQEAKANSYSKTANAITDRKSESDDSITQQQVKVAKPSSRNPMANRIQREAYENDNKPVTQATQNVKSTTANNNTSQSNRNSFYQGVTKLPNVEKTVDRVSGNNPKPVVLANSDNQSLIGQNVGDISLANILSGGIGMDRKLFK